MAHELEIFANGEASLAFTGNREKIWHGLGQEIPEGADVQEIIKLAHLDWEVEKRPLYSRLSNGDFAKTSQHELIRTDNGKRLDFIPDTWMPCQNEEAFGFFEEFVQNGDLEFSTAGFVKGGQNVWALAKIKNSLELFGEDLIENYILFSNPHRYGKSINIRLVTERVVCNNTLTFALNENARFEYSQNHRSEFNENLAKKAIGVANRYINDFADSANILASKTFTQAQAKEYFDNVFPLKTLDLGDNRKNKPREVSKLSKMCMDNLDVQAGAEIKQGTYWQLFNSVTNVIDFQAARNADNRLQSAWWGKGALDKRRALDVALLAAA